MTVRHRAYLGVLAAVALMAAACTSDGESPGRASDEAPGDDAGFTVWSFEALVATPELVGLEPGAPTADASVLVLEDGARVYFLAPGQGLRSLFAEDGLHFELEDGVRYPQPPANPAKVVPLPAGGFRAYHNDRDAGNIVSGFSDDGLTFEAEEGIRLSAADFARPDGREQTGLFMPPVVQLPDGSWRAWIPSAPATPYAPFYTWSATSRDGLEWTPDPDLVLGSEGAEVSLRDVTIARDGTFTGWFFRNGEIWAMDSPDGVTWSDERPVGVPGNDPDVFVLDDGSRHMFFGGFDPEVGGVIGLATETSATWALRRTGQGPGFVEAAVTGASEAALTFEAYDLARDEVLDEGNPRGVSLEVIGELPNVTLRLDTRSEGGPGNAVLIRVSDGSARQIA